MKKLLLTILFVFSFNQTVFAASYYTVGGQIACLSEEWLDDMFSFVAAKDMGSFEAYINSQKCLILKAGLPVTITDAGFMVHEIVISGIKLWVPVEAITK